MWFQQKVLTLIFQTKQLFKKNHNDRGFARSGNDNWTPRFETIELFSLELREKSIKTIDNEFLR